MFKAEDMCTLPADRMFNHANHSVGYSYQPPGTPENSVLDLRVYKEHEGLAGQLTPPRDGSPPVGVSPTLAVTQRVLAAAQGNYTRPFKAYPKDPLVLPSAQDEAYIRFREDMLSQMKDCKGNPRKRPASPQQAPDSRQEASEQKDAAYWERRRKNNEAAKRSRDARRAKEDEIAIRAAFLEQENLRLKYQLAVMSEESAHLRCLVYKGDQHPVAIPRYPPPPMV